MRFLIESNDCIDKDEPIKKSIERANRLNKGKNETLKEDLELSNEYDSEGNQLTKAQAEFFKNSKVRDEKGRLLVCYHGSPKQFNTFDKRRISRREDRIKGFYFSTKKRKGVMSDPYAYRYGGKIFECYLNITNPYIEYRGLEFDTDYSNMTYSNDGLIAIFGREQTDRWYDYESDTVKTTQINKGDIIEIVAFEPNQIKLITNKNPSNSNNINERLEQLNDDIFSTDSPYDVLNLLKNKPKIYRLLYDANLDLYFICDGSRYIHWDIIEKAESLGYYNHPKVIELMKKAGYDDFKPSQMRYLKYNYREMGIDGDEENDIDPYLIYMIFYPNGTEDDQYLINDGYDEKYPGASGTIYTRDSKLEDCDLYKLWMRKN